MDQTVTREVLQDVVLAEPVTVVRIETRRITIPPGLAAGVHVHNGPVVGTIERGSALYQLEGGELRVLGPGDAFFEPAGARVTRFDGGPEGVTFVASFPLAAGQDATIDFPENEA